MFKKPLFHIFLFGLLLRLFFFIYGAEIYYGAGKQYRTNDSFSYTESFLNLYDKGIFSFDLQNKDAYYGRLPGYPLFWGAHYIVFGEKLVYQAVAITQLILDAIAILLIFAITRHLTKNDLASWLASILYAGYPFIIVWNTITGTESLASFLTIFFFYWLFCKEKTVFNIIILGIIVAVTFYVREYLGILLFVAILHFFIEKETWKTFIKNAIVLGLAFGALYSLWPLRNYVNHHRLILLKTPTSGYERYGIDIISARSWIYNWTPDADIYLDSIAKGKQKVMFPQEAFTNEGEEQFVDSLVNLSRKCGTGFHFWAINKKYTNALNCNLEIAQGFDSLTQQYKKKKALQYYTDVPAQNLKKALFKSKLSKKNNSSLTTLLFAFRSVIVVLGFGCLVVLLKNKKYYPFTFFIFFIYIFICFYVRQVEMRYLIQADVLLIIPAGIAIPSITSKLKISKDETTRS